jgi:hypothetical protein
VDTTRVEAVGASLGVPFMSVAAATDARITRLWAVHGAGRSRDAARPQRAAVRAHAPAARARRSAPADALVAGERLTAERWIGRVAPRPVVPDQRRGDERLPRPAILALWDAAREPRTMIWMPGPHVQRKPPRGGARAHGHGAAADDRHAGHDPGRGDVRARREPRACSARPFIAASMRGRLAATRRTLATNSRSRAVARRSPANSASSSRTPPSPPA